MSEQIVYLDTTILIASFIHSPKVKFEIRDKIKSFKNVLTGQIAQQEFTRRLLKEAEYLLGLLKKKKTVAAVQRHLLSLSFHHNRKFRICLQTLTTIEEGANDEDNADRLRFFLEELLEDGVQDIRELLGCEILADVGCASAIQEIKKKGKSYHFPNSKCSSYGQCGISQFLTNHADTGPLKDFLLEKQDQLTNELKDGLDFLTKVCEDSTCAPFHNPCLCFGDTIISLESRQADVFYTQNYKESQLLCEQSGQVLLLCPTNDDNLSS